MDGNEAMAYYRLFAARCLEMSREASNEANRASLLTMAQVWMALADQADRSRDISAPKRALRPSARRIRARMRYFART